MKNILLSIVLVLINYNSFTQTISIVYGDTVYMKRHSNEIVWTFKKGLQDGKWIAFYDSKFTDTALCVSIINGTMHGGFSRWSPEDKYLEEESNYVNGKLNGIRKTYFYSKEKEKYTNITEWENGVLIKHIQLEW